MAKKARNTETTNSGLDNIAKVITASYAVALNTGALMLDVCRALKATYRGGSIPKADSDYIVAEVARANGWNGKSLNSRKSELVSVMSAYTVLPEALSIVKGKDNKPVSFTNAVVIARYIKQGATAKAAAAAFKKPAVKKPKLSDMTLVEARTSSAAAVKRILQMTKLPAKFRNDLRTLCEENKIEV